jgi:hypothetical protein
LACGQKEKDKTSASILLADVISYFPSGYGDKAPGGFDIIKEI